MSLKFSQIMIWLIRNFTSVIKYLIYRSRFPLSNLFFSSLRQNILLSKSSYIVLDLARGTIFLFQFICSAHDFHFMYTKTNWWSNHFAKYILLINNEYTFIRVFYNYYDDNYINIIMLLLFCIKLIQINIFIQNSFLP